MKRSEILKIISNYLGQKDGYNVTIDCDRLLFCLEKNGMQPPKVKNKVVKPKDYKYGAMCTMRCSCEYCDPNIEVNEWEKE